MCGWQARAQRSASRLPHSAGPGMAALSPWRACQRRCSWGRWWSWRLQRGGHVAGMGEEGTLHFQPLPEASTTALSQCLNTCAVQPLKVGAQLTGHAGSLDGGVRVGGLGDGGGAGNGGGAQVHGAGGLQVLDLQGSPEAWYCAVSQPLQASTRTGLGCHVSGRAAATRFRHPASVTALTVRRWGVPTAPMFRRALLVVMVMVLGLITMRLVPSVMVSTPAGRGNAGCNGQHLSSKPSSWRRHHPTTHCLRRSSKPPPRGSPCTV